MRVAVMLRSLGDVPLLAGMRVSLIARHRLAVRNIRRILSHCGVDGGYAALVARCRAIGMGVGSLCALVASVCAPGFVESFPGAHAELLCAVALLWFFAVLAWVAADVRVRRRHGNMLLLLSFCGKWGFRLGSLFPAFVAVVIVLVQVMRSDDSALMCWGAVMSVAMVICCCAGLRSAVGVAWSIRLGAVLGMVFFCHRYLRGHGWVRVPAARDVWITLIAGAIIMVAAVMSSLAAAWLGKRRCAPRNASDHFRVGCMVALVLAVSWCIALGVGMVDRLAHLTDMVVLSGVVIVFLVLRVRAARFVNPESLGYALFLARDLRVGAEPLLRFYRLNWFALSFPVIIGGLVLLALVPSVPGMLLLMAFVMLECAVEELAVQRRTTVLPSSRIGVLGIGSISGLGAGACLMMVLPAAGAAGFTPSLDLREHSSTVGIVAGLILLIAATLAWLRLSESSQWLSSIHATEVRDD